MQRALADKDLKNFISKVNKHGINRTFQDKTTPLMLACQYHYVPAINYLLENNAEVNAQDIYGQTAINNLLKNGILRKHSDLDYIVSMLIESGADVNLADNAGLTPLHYASVLQALPIIENLVDNGADVNAVTRFNVSPVLMCQNDDLVIYFLNHGADPNIQKNTDGDFLLLHICKESPSLSLVQYMIENREKYGIDIGLKDRHGETAFKVLSKWGYAKDYTLWMLKGNSSKTTISI